ncbi:MAG: vWA domain-containing protein [Candidatus Bathyarchaeia archaeon]
MAIDETGLARVFDQARTELYCPPCRLEVLRDLDRRGERLGLRVQSSVSRGVVQVDAEAVQVSRHPEDYLLWSLRHSLGHAHYCPYDIRTAYELQKAAYSIVRSRELSLLALLLFSDLQLDCVYLRNRFRTTPYHLEEDFRRERPKGVGRLFYSAYRIFYPSLPAHHMPGEYSTYAGLIAETIRLPKPWLVKVQTIAAILRELKARNPGLLKEVEVKRHARLSGSRGLPLQEDLSANSAKLVSSVMAEIKDPEEAKFFFEQWVQPRLPKEAERRQGRQEALQKLKRRVERPREGGGGGEGSETKEEGPGLKREEGTKGESQSLPTSLSKRVGVHAERGEAYWKRYWYRARAERVIIRYLAESPRMKPTWQVLSYPEEWNVDDEIEALDVEASLDDGPLIPEVTTVKWRERLMGFGQGPVSGYVPSVVVVLDSSRSMASSYDEASTAAYIAYLSAAWAGGETACISFSTDYLVAGWAQSMDSKELVLATHLGGLTLMPMPSILQLVEKMGGPCYVVIITDGGWQNIKEVVPPLRKLSSEGHTVTIFHLKGWEYPDEVRTLRAIPQTGFHEVETPEADLQGLILAQAMSMYERYIR